VVAPLALASQPSACGGSSVVDGLPAGGSGLEVQVGGAVQIISVGTDGFGCAL
jgi:hypothetical protein